MPEPIPELNPPSGGRWLRDPQTGELTPLPPADEAGMPDQPPAAPAQQEE
jgi:hypothetical protein